MKGKTVAESRVTLTQLMGPAQSNTLGNVHGGLIMKLCDEAGGMTAAKHARRPSVTVTVDSMTFHSPVHIGNLVTVTAEVTWVGRTSMETRVVVSAENVLTGAVTHTNTAYFVYVALGEDGKPVTVPPLICETTEEQARFERAAARQSARLERRRQEKND
ncbi:MAG: acyl-CoA thioesterase [Ardenticatenaceae bacterium]|nr:acyl-CoA thioesterase [Ardenticatenaceae bacterium]MCB9443549.1 acyl-CoA thioesterase [Ardenticatenaceae bacterium]